MRTHLFAAITARHVQNNQAPTLRRPFISGGAALAWPISIGRLAVQITRRDLTFQTPGYMSWITRFLSTFSST